MIKIVLRAIVETGCWVLMGAKKVHVGGWWGEGLKFIWLRKWTLFPQYSSFMGAGSRLKKHKNNILSASISPFFESFRQLQIVGVKGNLLSRAFTIKRHHHKYFCVELLLSQRCSLLDVHELWFCLFRLIFKSSEPETFSVRQSAGASCW